MGWVCGDREALREETIVEEPLRDEVVGLGEVGRVPGSTKVRRIRRAAMNI